MISPIDNKNIQVKSNAIAEKGLTKLELNGSFLDVSGYARIKGLPCYSEDGIRKTLLLIPELDLEHYRESQKSSFGESEIELTDEEIIEKHTIKISMDNCMLNELDNVEITEKDDPESLDGFHCSIDLSNMNKGKPLLKGEYDCFIQLEQLTEAGDIKYKKLLSISAVKSFMKSDVMTTKLEYFSAKEVLKYNLSVSFNKSSKTLHLKNNLLLQYDPRDMPDNNEVRENKYIKALKRRLFKLFYLLCCVLPINKNKVSFASDSRSELNGNFYFVYEELYSRNLNLKIRFLFNERINNKKSIRDLLKLAYEFATSKVILLDDFYPMIYSLKIRKNADLIQIWHAAGAFKTFGYSRTGRPGGPSPKSRNHKNYTKAVVSSESVRKHYAEGFGITLDKVYPTGVPRSDIFFDDQYKKHVQSTLHEKYPFLKGKKVILFAPTFRGNGQSSAYYPFEVLNLKMLYESLHEDYVFLFKIHPFVQNKFTIPYMYADFFYDLSDYREINDLLLITDILITDYSSVCFEFALLNRPMLFFAYDVEEYIETRDFYYNYFDFIPGPLVKSTSEIISSIQNKKFEMERIAPFVKYFFDDTLGIASKNVVDHMIIPSLEDLDHEDINEELLPPPDSRIELFERSLGRKEDE